MKKLAIFTLGILVLFVGASMYVPSTANINNQTIHINGSSSDDLGLDQDEDLDRYYPILWDVTVTNPDNIELIRERSDTGGEGAIYQVQPYTNVTFRYAVALQNTTTFDPLTVDFRLFADLPIVNTTNFNNTGSNTRLSLANGNDTLTVDYINDNTTIIDYTLPFDPSITYDNATIYFFETEPVNVSVSYLPFYVQDLSSLSGESEEANNKPYNFITTSQYFNTSSQDEFYIQGEIANITGNLYFNDTNVDNFGIDYRVDTSPFQVANFTVDVTGTEYPINSSGIISLDEYEVGTNIIWMSIFNANDTLINVTREISRIDFKTVEFGDGRPQLDIKVDTPHPDALLDMDENHLYTQNFTVTYNTTANLPKGNITELYLIPDIGESQIDYTEINSSLTAIELSQTFDYSTLVPSGTTIANFNTTIFAVTDKGLTVNETYIITVDQEDPNGNIAVSNADSENKVTSSNGEVTIEFTFDDQVNGSGIKIANIDMGDGTAYEVTHETTLSHQYRDFEGEVFSIVLTIIDRAGNEVDVPTFVEIEDEGVDLTNPPRFEIYLFLVGLIVLVLSPWWGPKIKR